MENPTPRAWQVPAICVLLVVAVLLVFWQTTRNGFANYDDGPYIYENAAVTRGLSLEGVAWAFTHVHAANWHPVTTISHMADCQLYGLNARGHHVTNVILHAGVVVLLFLMLRDMTGALWRSAFVAVIFAVHPLRVESVAWIAERKDLLSGLFFILTLWAWLRYVRRPGSRGRYALVMLWFALGLMSKPMLVTVPCVLLLVDFWPLGRLKNRAQFALLCLEKIPLLALSAFSCIATIIAQQTAIQGMEYFTFSQRLASAAVAYMVYLQKWIWPAGLAVFYPFPKSGLPAWEILAAFALLAALTVGAWMTRRKQPFILMGWFWYLGMLVPVIGLLQVGGQTYADRYTYLPQIGLAIAVTWVVAEWAAKSSPRTVAVRTAGVAIPCLFLGIAYHQTGYWRDNITLWTHTLSCTADNSIAHNNFGLALYQQRRLEEAAPHFREALRIDSVYAEYHLNLANVLFVQKQTADAIVEYREAARLKPDIAVIRLNLANALLQQGSVNEAIAEYRETTRLDPGNAEALANLGHLLCQQGAVQEGLPHLKKALQLSTANPAMAAALQREIALYESSHP